MAIYSRTVLDELAWIDEITGTCFECFDRFEVLCTVSMLYFIAAIYCEQRERAGAAGPDAAFLLADDRQYRDLAFAIARSAPTVPRHQAGQFAEKAARDLAKYIRAGLCDPARRNLYPFAE
jgi:FADH2 O2-dependent halogenase